MKNKKNILIGISSLLLITLILLGLTYAYYRTRIIGNNNEKSISVTSKKLSVKYQNESSVINIDKVKPGDTLTKTFEVYNNGDKTAYYAIVFDNVVNEFTRSQDWTYKLSDGSNEVASGTLPTVNDYMLSSVAIEQGVTKRYTLEIKYANLKNIDQSIDMEKRISFKIDIEDAVVSWENAEGGTLLYLLKNNQPVGTVETTPGQPSNSTPTSYIEQPFDETTYEMTVGFQCTDSGFYFRYATGYTFNENNGYSLTGVNSQNVYNDIYSDLSGKYITSAVIWRNCVPSDASKSYTGLSSIYKIVNATADKITYQKLTSERIGGEARILETEDDYGTSYVYRGNVTNNYVNYSGMCWRVVRVQGDGTIKLVLADENGTCDASTYSITKPSSYINGGTAYQYKNLKGRTPTTEDAVFATSDLVPVLKNWLDNKKIDVSKLINAKWCNDTSVANYRDGIANFNSNRTTPTLKCDMKGVEGAKGVESQAQIYTGNIGILNADETVFAGANMSIDEIYYNHYLQTNTGDGYGELSWVMTPSYYPSNDVLKMLVLSGYDFGYLFGMGSEVSSTLPVRPSVVLKSSVLATTKADIVTYGQPGTHTNPYVVS